MCAVQCGGTVFGEKAEATHSPPLLPLPSLCPSRNMAPHTHDHLPLHCLGPLPPLPALPGPPAVNAVLYVCVCGMMYMRYGVHAIRCVCGTMCNCVRGTACMRYGVYAVLYVRYRCAHQTCVVNSQSPNMPLSSETWCSPTHTYPHLPTSVSKRGQVSRACSRRCLSARRLAWLRPSSTASSSYSGGKGGGGRMTKGGGGGGQVLVFCMVGARGPAPPPALHGLVKGWVGDGGRSV